jgi:hypothetical protein
VEAPEAAAIARELIPQFHCHLAEARIAYRSRIGGEWYSKGHVCYGKAILVSGPVRELTGEADETPYDFLCLVNGDEWGAMTDTQKRACVDHQLCHMSRSDAGKWSLAAHDLEEFGPVVVRWGLWHPDVERFAGAVMDAPGTKQLRLEISQVAGGAGAAAGEVAATDGPGDALSEADALEALARAHRGQLDQVPDAVHADPEEGPGAGDNVRPIGRGRRRTADRA